MNDDGEVTTAGDPLRRVLLTVLRISMLPDDEQQNDADADAISNLLEPLPPRDLASLAGIGTLLLAATPPRMQADAMHSALELGADVVWRTGPPHESTPNRAERRRR